jgi:uncharacterized OsmC-like protein/alpha/beta superfamily hydrolase
MSATHTSSVRLDIEGSDGQLSARLERPAGQPRAWALFAHCFTCTKESLAAARISSALAARGIATVRFDFTGLGESDGDFSSTNFSSNIEDLLLVSEHMARELEAPSIVIGHSFGGAAVLAAAGGIPQAKGFVTLGAPCDPAHIRHLLSDDDAQTIATEGTSKVELGGRSFTLKRQFLDDIDEQKTRSAVAKLHRPLLVLHAPDDDIVGIDNGEAIFAAAQHPKSFVSLEGTDHLLTSPEAATWVADLIASWASRHVAPEQLTEPVPAGSEHHVEVQESGQGRYQQHLQAGPHRLIGDEPASLGGEDSGPSPYQFLLAALGTCTSMTMRMYAERKGWPLEHIRVVLDHDKIHATDCADCETEKGKVDVIERRIFLQGDLDDEQRQRILEIADKCPVHRTLHSEIKVRTHLEDR